MVLGTDGAFEFRRERALAESHAVADATIVKVGTSSASRGGCAIRQWIEFQPPGRAETFAYHEPWNIFSDSSSIDAWDPDDEHCLRSRKEYRTGDRLRMAFVPEDPSINRPYYGNLKRGHWSDQWKSKWLGALLLAGVSVLCGVMWRRQARTLENEG
jgi:hypothetical protein